MTRTCYARGLKYSERNIINSVLDASNGVELADGEAEDITSDIICEVDRNLPGTMSWEPYTSELHIDIDDDSELTEDEFDEILNEAFWDVFAKRGLL